MSPFLPNWILKKQIFWIQLLCYNDMHTSNVLVTVFDFLKVTEAGKSKVIWWK